MGLPLVGEGFEEWVHESVVLLRHSPIRVEDLL
jgi:hypothetical protein